MSLQKYATAAERKAAKALVKIILEAGATISVNDGEEWTVKKSTKPSEIHEELCTSDGPDTLLCHASTGERLGSFFLMFDDIQDEGIEVVYDYSANAWAETVYEELSQAV